MTGFFPFPSLEDIKTTYRARCADLSRDINNLLPAWARPETDTIFKKRKIIVCGAVSRAEIRVLARHTDIVGIVDDFASGNVFGIPIINSDAWIDRARSDKRIVSCLLLPRNKGYNYFLQRCMMWDLPFLDPLHILYLMKHHKMDTRGEVGAFFTYGYEFFEFTIKNWERLLQIGERLDDAYSRFSWFCMLMYRLTLNPFYIEACCVGMHEERFSLDAYEINRHFFRFSDEEVYIDGGAHVGYGVGLFLRAVNGKFKHIYTFEPLAEHNREIRKRLNWLRGVYLDRIENKITIIEKGLWNGEGKLRFATAHTHQSCVGFSADTGEMVGGAHFIEGGIADRIFDNETMSSQAMELPVTSVDLATNQDATFIKFEVEGSELKAMEGAIKTIARNRPLMSIGIYHKPEDYVTLTDFVQKLDMGYKLGFRHHYPLGPASTVLYAYR